jgi:hypothetical protein
MAIVQVMGAEQTAGGLKESMAKFRKHHAEEGDQLLNVSGIGTVTGERVDKDDPRMPYVKQSFPKMIYHPEKGELTVYDEAELKAHLAKGYRTEPYPKAQVALEDPKAEKAALELKLKQKDGEIASLNDVLVRAMARLDALESKNEDKGKK